MQKRLLNILRCPITHKGLSHARGEMLGRVNTAIAEGRISNEDGAVLSEPLSEALITDDGKFLYRVQDGIPVLLDTESIRLKQLE